MLSSLSFFLFSLSVLYFLCICVSFGLFAPLSVVFPSPITSSSYCVIGVCPCGPFSISTSLLHLCSFRPLSVCFPFSSFLCLSFSVQSFWGAADSSVLLSAVPLCRWLPAVNPSSLFHTDTRLSSSSHHPLCQSHTHPLITIRFIRETVRKS